MATNDDAPLPAHFGDNPHDAFWSAAPPPGAEADELVDRSISGPVIRMMWDYGVRIPLWDAEGLLPEESEWLREALGLSERLIDDLRRWGIDMSGLDAHPRRRTEEAYSGLDVRGRALAQRLQQEVGSSFNIKYHPW